MIEPDHPQLPITRQCALVGVSRSAFYGGPRTESPETVAALRAIDGQFLETPWYGSQSRASACGVSWPAWGWPAIYREPKSAVRHPQHRVFSYRLRNMAIDRPDQAWCADITDIPMRRGCLT